jgi:ATP-dependent DNA helicase RecG
MQVDVTMRPVMGATWSDLDPLEFVRLRRILEENRGDEILLELSDEELARALGLVRQEAGALTPTLAGLLLLGMDAALRKHVPTHEIAFQVMRGTDVAVNEFCRWPVLRALEWVMESFQVRNEERELNVGLFRVGIPAFDRRGFREAANNAFIHRDYTQLGAVHIQMHDDHVRISNPGGFVVGIRPDNLLVTEPRARNPRMADAFKRIGLVERTGRGVAIIYQGQLRNGRMPPDYGLSTETGVTVLLPGGPADLSFVQLVVTEENRLQHTFNAEQLLILAHVWRERTIDTPTAARLAQRDDSHIRSVLENLVEIGLLERRGDKKGRTYLLSASVYREIGHPEAYVRARGFEPLQMEQMIFQFIQAHGQITRREVVDLCRLSQNQASYLLKKLTARGDLQLVAAGRSAHYKLGKTRKNSK